LIELGATVALLDVNARACGNAAEILGRMRKDSAVAVACDLRDEEATRDAVRRTVDDLGGLDILVHCAGYLGSTRVPGWVEPFEAQTVPAWDAAIAAGAALDLAGTLTVSAGTGEIGANTATAANVTVNGGTLSMTGSGGILRLASGGTFSMSSGTITTADVVTAPVLTTSGTEGTNFFTVNFTGGTLNVAEWDIRSVDSTGVQIGSTVTLTAFNRITWSNTFQTTAGTADSLLNAVSQTATLTTTPSLPRGPEGSVPCGSIRLGPSR
jgi:NAD(P)-dependent dehydrogenase (short-subunit alcohol dehydrogenase family)